MTATFPTHESNFAAQLLEFRSQAKAQVRDAKSKVGMINSLMGIAVVSSMSASVYFVLTNLTLG